jgi:transcriptional regulator with XRE-family HTH domain
MAELGTRLRSERITQRKSLKDVASKAGISTAYLQKLETDAVRNPSPHILHRLADELGIIYFELMRLAGYVVPDQEPGADLLAQALQADELTDEEARALGAFLRHLRETV